MKSQTTRETPALETPSQVATRLGDRDLKKVAGLIEKHCANPKFLDWVRTFANWQIEEIAAN